MSNIEWTDETWQVTAGCNMVSSGCANCYAEKMAWRLLCMAEADLEAGKDPKRKRPYLHVLNEGGGWNGRVLTLPDRLTDPLRWKRPRRIFVNSMSDLFHEDVPFEFIDRVWAVMALCPQHTFQILTKRPERMAEYVNRRGAAVAHYDALWKFSDAYPHVAKRLPESPESGDPWPLPNVWLGTSVEDQKAADERIPHLLGCPAAVRFLSCEPLLGPVDLLRFLDPDPLRIGVRNAFAQVPDWVIVGGESGPKARPCDVGWIRGVVRQCREANMPVFVKQLGSFPFCDSATGNPADIAMFERRLADRKGGDPAEWPEDLRVREWPWAGGGA